MSADLMTAEVVLEYLRLVLRISQHVAEVAVAIIGTGVVLWALVERYDWPLQTAGRVHKSTGTITGTVASTPALPRGINDGRS
jgi:hypothetical protein